MAMFSTLTFADYTAIAGLLVSTVFTIWQFYVGRRDAKLQYQLLEKLTDKIANGTATDTTLQAVSSIMSKTK